jgi:hypothetical protein
MEPGVVARIVAAASTADAPVADAAQRLAAVSAAAADMAGVCSESGLESAG